MTHDAFPKDLTGDVKPEIEDPKFEDVVGLLPAGGQATRLAPLPVSKELLPIGFYSNPADRLPRPKTVCHYLLEKYRLAGVQKAFVILRPGKWDIPAYFGDGTLVDMHLGYLTVPISHGVPYTLNQSYPFIRGMRVVLGFPDILFEPADGFVQLLAHQTATAADVVLGAVPTEQPWKGGMIDFDGNGRVWQVIEKPQRSDLRWTWMIACWSPQFTEFLHQFVLSNPQPEREIPIGDVIHAAIAQGLRVEVKCFPQGHYLDVGTPQDFAKAVRAFSGQAG